MQYLQLTYRRKADLECGNEAARKADLAQADEWTQKAMGARKTNEMNKEKKVGGGVYHVVAGPSADRKASRAGGFSDWTGRSKEFTKPQTREGLQSDCDNFGEGDAMND